MSGFTVAAPPVNVTVSTPGTPLWLTLLTLGISIAAVMITLWQALVNNSERRRNFPHVQVSASYTGHYYDSIYTDVRAVILSAWNRGREAGY
jgi:hypothetical protein